MEMIQQLFMAAFATFVLSIVVEKLACVTINGDERKSTKTIVHNTKTKSKNKSRSPKKVRFALHDQIAIVVNNKLVKLDPVKPPADKQIYGPTSYDLSNVYFGANWMGEELMIYKELGLYIDPQELGFGGIEKQIEVSDDKALGWLADIEDNMDNQAEEGKNYKIVIDFAPKGFTD